MQGVLPVGRFPQSNYEEVTASVEGRQLLLLIICLENQGNDSRNDHAELKQFCPRNHNRHPLSCDWGQRRALPPKKIEGNRLPGYY